MSAFPAYLSVDPVPPLDDYGFLMPYIEDKESSQAEWLGKLLYRTLRPKSVIDWGCASGLYLLPFQKQGVEICGIDAEATAGASIPGNFYQMDIRMPIQTDKYDLALCIEVGEHLQPEYAEVLVQNVVRSADVVFWSAARPKQGGDYHYNEQPISYWLLKFARYNFMLHDENDRMLAQLQYRDMTPWMRRNSRLLRRI